MALSTSIYSRLFFCLTGKWGYHRQGSCQAGLGAAIAEVSTMCSHNQSKATLKRKCCNLTNLLDL